MFGRDILDGGEKELLKLKELVQEKEQYEKNLKELESKGKEAAKQMEKKKKEVEKTIAENEKMEREKVEAPFVAELNKLEKSKKEISEDRSKARKAKIDEEIKEQTDGWRNIQSDQKKRIRQLAQEDKIPLLGISELFFAFFYPKNRKDILFLLVGLVIIFLLIPFGIYHLFWENGGKLAIVSIYLGVTVVFGLLYILINNTIKEKHLEAFQKINLLRGETKETERNIKEKIQQIEKKTDEELLGSEQAEQYRNMLGELENQIKYQKSEKEKALEDYEHKVEEKEKRAQGIWNENKPEMDMLQRNIDEVFEKKENEKVQLEKVQDELNSEKYQPLREAEKNILRIKVLDELIAYINSGEAKNIRLAIEKRKNPKEISGKK